MKLVSPNQIINSLENKQGKNTGMFKKHLKKLRL